MVRKSSGGEPSRKQLLRALRPFKELVVNNINVLYCESELIVLNQSNELKKVYL